MWTGGDAAAAKAKKSSKKGAQAADAGRELERELIAAAKAGLGRGGEGGPRGRGTRHACRRAQVGMPIKMILKNAMPETQRDTLYWLLDLLCEAATQQSTSKMGVRSSVPGGGRGPGAPRDTSLLSPPSLPSSPPPPRRTTSPSSSHRCCCRPTQARRRWSSCSAQRTGCAVRPRELSRTPRVPRLCRHGRDGACGADALPLSCRGQVTLVKSLLVTHEKDRPKPAASDLAEGDESATGIDTNGDGAVGEVPPAA